MVRSCLTKLESLFFNNFAVEINEKHVQVANTLWRKLEEQNDTDLETLFRIVFILCESKKRDVSSVYLLEFVRELFNCVISVIKYKKRIPKDCTTNTIDAAQFFITYSRTCHIICRTLCYIASSNTTDKDSTVQEQILSAVRDPLAKSNAANVQVQLMYTLEVLIDTDQRFHALMHFKTIEPIIQAIDRLLRDEDSFYLNQIKQENLLPSFMQHWLHVVATVLASKLEEPPQPPITTRFISKQCLWGMYNGTTEHCKESIQFIYMMSQSTCQEYQDELHKQAREIIQACVHCLRAKSDSVIYMVLSTWKEWIEELSDHLIVTKSVRAIGGRLLETNDQKSIVLLPSVIPLLYDHHPKITKIVLEMFSMMSSVISSTTGIHINFFAEYLQEMILRPVVQNQLENIDQEKCIKSLLSEKRLVPMLMDVGALPMIESYRDVNIDLKMLRGIEKENKTADDLIRSITDQGGQSIVLALTGGEVEKNIGMIVNPIKRSLL